MRILIDIGDPAHVHFFKNMIHELKKRRHEIKIIARDKEITLSLLNVYGFDFENRGRGYTGLFWKARGLIHIDQKIYKIAKKFEPDVLTGIGNPYVAHVSRLLGKPSIIFEDTEHAKLINYLTFPFAHVICTPSCFLKNLGRKQVTYDGYQELAYLHPNYFKPDPHTLKELGLTGEDKFFVLRFLAREAIHDIRLRKPSLIMKIKLVKKLKEYGEVFITSESDLLPTLKEFQFPLSPEKIHDLLYFASMYVGEGGTMATEAAILGTPSVRINPLSRYIGVHRELQNKYKLMYFFSEFYSALDKINSLLNKNNLKDVWKKRKNKMMKDKINVTKWMVNFIESYQRR